MTMQKNWIAFLLGILLLPMLSPFVDLLANILRSQIFDAAEVLRFDLVNIFLVTSAGIALFSAISEYLKKTLGTRFSSDMERIAKQKIADSVVARNTPLEDSEFIQIHQKAGDIGGYCGAYISLIFCFIALLVVFMYSILFISWLFALMILISLPLLFVFQLYLQKLEKQSNSLLVQETVNNRLIRQAAKAIDLIKSYRMDEPLQNLYDKNINTSFAIKSEKLKLIVRMDIIQTAVKLYMSIAFPAVCGFLVYFEKVTVGNVFIASAIFGVVMNNIGGVMNSMQKINSIKPITRRLDLLYNTTDISEHSSTVSIPVPPMDVVLENVTFSYDHRSPLFQHLNLSFPAKSLTVIVGRSGCGKTTLLKILAGVEKCEEGDYWFGRQNLGFDDIPDYVSYASQQTNLLPVSIAENIQYGAEEELSPEQIAYYPKKLGIDDFIQRLPHGYDSYVQEDSVNLSGGQKQCIGLVRALNKKAPLMLLDEVTSSQDRYSKKRIQETIHEQRMVIEVSHDLEIIRLAERIVFLDQGKVIGLGTHDELIRDCSEYARFIGEEIEDA